MLSTSPYRKVLTIPLRPSIGGCAQERDHRILAENCANVILIFCRAVVTEYTYYITLEKWQTRWWGFNFCHGNSTCVPCRTIVAHVLARIRWTIRNKVRPTPAPIRMKRFALRPERLEPATTKRPSLNAFAASTCPFAAIRYPSACIDHDQFWFSWFCVSVCVCQWMWLYADECVCRVCSVALFAFHLIPKFYLKFIQSVVVGWRNRDDILLELSGSLHRVQSCIWCARNLITQFSIRIFNEMCGRAA